MNDASIIVSMNCITDKPHNNKPVTKVEISPSGRYLVTYSQEDHSVVGWNVEDVDEGQLESNGSVKTNYEINRICVSDDKKLAYINNDKTLLNIIDMRNNNRLQYFKDIENNKQFDEYFKPYYCAFNSKGEFVLFNLYRERHFIIYIYSTQTNNNKLKYKKSYGLPKDFTEFIIRHNKLYSFSNDYVYEWNSLPGNFIRMFWMDTKFETKDVRISSNDKFICLKIEDEIIIYSFELRIPIATLDINNDIQIYNFMKHTGLCLVLLQLFDRIPNKGIWNSIMNYCWKESLDRLNMENPLPNNIRTTNNYAFGILDGYVWKIKVETIKEDFEYLNAHLFSPYMDDIRTLFDVASSNCVCELEFNQWKIKIDDEELQVFKDEGYRTSTKIAKIVKLSIFKKYLISSKLFNNGDNGDILILTTIGLFIYHFNENNKSISLNYYYYMYPGLQFCYYYKTFSTYYYMYPGLQFCYYYKKFSTPTLPLLNYKSFKLNNKWTSYLIDNKSSLLKYGVELLSFSIKEHKLELIEDIYKKCMIYFKQDLRNNSKFLSIITSTMPLLNEYYPEYILRYSLETAMIIDSPIYSIKNRNIKLHLYSFLEYPPKVNLMDPSTLWSIYMYQLNSIKSKLPRVLTLIPLIVFYNIVILCLFSISLTFLLLSILKYHQTIAVLFSISTFTLIYFIYTIYLRHSKPSVPTVTFMISYIKFVNYPRDYCYILELFWPKSSPFVNTINRDIYKTWNGEALINFKWNTYGKYYYYITCIVFMVLFGCFTAVATIPKDENLKTDLLKASITLGSFHLFQEFRQFIYNPKKWFRNYWNFFDLFAYLIPTATSILWLRFNNENTSLLSFSCLLLDIKFLLFFRAFESFGIYFAIIVGVAKQLISFLVILFIIIISFAHAFLILLKPKLGYDLDQPTVNNDPNNPWNLNTTYYNQINGTAQNASFVQAPDENTNMFTDYGTALFAVYLFLTGDSSALSNKWPYKEHPALVILIILFSFMIVVYLMNLFIGLLNIAIERDNNRVSYLMQKAEILVEIELFYLSPCQRRWKAWFPEVIHYYANVIKTREKVKEMNSKGELNINDFPEDLLNKLNIQ